MRLFFLVPLLLAMVPATMAGFELTLKNPKEKGESCMTPEAQDALFDTLFPVVENVLGGVRRLASEEGSTSLRGADRELTTDWSKFCRKECGDKYDGDNYWACKWFCGDRRLERDRNLVNDKEKKDTDKEKDKPQKRVEEALENKLDQYNDSGRSCDGKKIQFKLKLDK